MNLFRTPQQLSLIGRPTFAHAWVENGGASKAISVAIDIYSYCLLGNYHPTEGQRFFSRGFHEMDLAVLSNGRRADLASRLASLRHNDGEPAITGPRGVTVEQCEQGRSLERQIPMSRATLDAFEQHLLVLRVRSPIEMHTGLEPQAENIQAMISLGGLVDRVETCLACGQWEELAGFLESGLKCETALKCTSMTPQTNHMFNTARIYGAWGGTFDGRCMILIVPPEKRSKVINILAETTADLKIRVDLFGTVPLYIGK